MKPSYLLLASLMACGGAESASSTTTPSGNQSSTEASESEAADERAEIEAPDHTQVDLSICPTEPSPDSVRMVCGTFELYVTHRIYQPLGTREDPNYSTTMVATMLAHRLGAEAQVRQGVVDLPWSTRGVVNEWNSVATLTFTHGDVTVTCLTGQSRFQECVSAAETVIQSGLPGPVRSAVLTPRHQGQTLEIPDGCRQQAANSIECPDGQLTWFFQDVSAAIAQATSECSTQELGECRAGEENGVATRVQCAAGSEELVCLTPTGGAACAAAEFVDLDALPPVCAQLLSIH